MKRPLLFVSCLLISSIVTSPTFAAIIDSQDFKGDSLATVTLLNTGFPLELGLTFDSDSDVWWIILHGSGRSISNLSGTQDLIGVVDINAENVSNGLDDATGITGNWFHAENPDKQFR